MRIWMWYVPKKGWRPVKSCYGWSVKHEVRFLREQGLQVRFGVAASNPKEGKGCPQ